MDAVVHAVMSDRSRGDAVRLSSRARSSEFDMTPFERVKAKAEAAAMLSVPISATQDELKLAWKRKAFQVHPDKMDGDETAFMEAQDAYAFMQDFASETPSPRGRVRPSRPVAGGITTDIPRDTVSAFQGILAAHNLQGKVPGKVRVAGRQLSYVLDTALKSGDTHLVLSKPGTGERRDEYKPFVVAISALETSARGLHLPRKMVADRFPGSSSVTVLPAS